MKRSTPTLSSSDASYPTPAMKELFEAIRKIKSTDEAANFFRDLLTIAELKEFSNRWQVVKLLYEGRTYEGVAKHLMISTATVTRVAHWLHHGMDGYRTVAERMKFRSQAKDV